MNGKSLTQGTPWKLVLMFALPVFVGNLLQQMYNTVDTIIAGNFVSEDALAAVGTTACLTMLFLALAQGFAAGAGVIVAQLFGAKRNENLRENVETSIILMLGMGVVASIIGFFFCKIVFKNFLEVPDTLLDMAVTYFRIYSIGLVFQFGYNIIAAVLRAMGDSKATLYFLLISSVINTLLAILFVAIFHWGVAGAAIATNIAQACSCLAGFLYMWKKYPLFRFKFKELHFDKRIVADVIRIGFPMALQQVIVSFGFFFIQRAVNSYGQYMTASFTVEQRIENYLMMPAVAFQITMATYCGQNIGAGKMERVTKGVKQTLVMSEIITICLALISFFFAGPIIGVFGISENAAIYCTQHLQSMSFVLLIFAGYFPILGLFQGAGDGFAATIVATMALVCRVVTTYTLGYIPLIGYTIIWWGQMLGWILGCIITWKHYLDGKWKTKIFSDSVKREMVAEVDS